MKKILFLMLFISITNCFAQPEKGNVGISASLQNSQLDFLIPIFLGDNIAISPAAGIVNISDQLTDISLGLIIRYYLTESVVTPFISGRVGAMILSPKEGDTITDIVFGPSFGGEYFFAKHFSMGIELQLNIAKSADNSLRFNNPGGTNINTATAIFATIYF